MKNNYKSIKLTALLLVVVMLGALLTGCGLLLGYDAEQFGYMMDEVLVSMFTGDGISVNILLENPSAMGLAGQPATLPLPPFDKDEYEDGTEQVKQIATMFRFVNGMYLTEADKCTKETIIDFFTTYSKYSEFYYLSNRDYIGVSDGWNVMLPLYLDKLAFKTENDVKNWISLVNQTEHAFSEYVRFEKKVLIPAGYERAKSTYTGIAEQCEDMAQKNGDEHFVYELFLDKIMKVDFLTTAQKEEYTSQARSAVEVMIKAYKNLATEMKLCAIRTFIEEEKPIAQYDEGKEYYELVFKDNASTSDSIETARDNLLYAFNSTLTKYYQMMEEINYYHPPADMSMEAIQGYYDTLKSQYSNDFPALNSNIPDATFFEVPEALGEVYNPASYFKSAIDSLTAPETIYINKENVGSYLGFDIISHEGLPGHMLQHAYFKSTGVHPLRSVLGYTGYAEGWASYAQFYSAKYYPGTEVDKRAYEAKCLYDKAMLYFSTLIDIEINYYGKTYEQMTKHALYSQVFNGSNSSKETYNYMVQNPAVYSSYGYGNYKMEQLRGKFNGTDYEFHKAVLSMGPTSFEILAKYILN